MSVGRFINNKLLGNKPALSSQPRLSLEFQTFCTLRRATTAAVSLRHYDLKD
jgi:hypothetical protein